jgi:hypothetical protein
MTEEAARKGGGHVPRVVDRNIPRDGAARCYTCAVPTSHPRHSITETPALAAVLEPLRARLGAQAPTLAELVKRGAEAHLRELDALDRARGQALETFVDRLCDGPPPDLDEVRRIRHASRRR